MRPEALLTAIAVVVLAATVALALFVPGFLAEPDADEPPARLDVTETTFEVGEVTGETVTFDVTAFVRHRGGTAENVSVAVRAIDESGALSATATHDIDRLEDDGEHQLPLSITVPREGSYEIRTVLYVDGERTDVATASVSGVEALTPPYADSTVQFHQFTQQPSVEYAIESVDDDRATLRVTSYLTNGGDDLESGLRLSVTARHADAGVVADRDETNVGSIDPGRTEFVEATVTVPDESNYYLAVTLWRDGVILESTRTVANLDPQQTIDADETVEPVEFEASEFETERDERPPPEPERDATESQPGFGVGAAIVALLLGAAAARRRSP